ncbi:nucleolar protein [Perkinsela sp. CCAP 1560/4]|nr:nucleolar protein [Perkinsela sp. CCAP 1560/4]|eukprot:KNH08711.1 nucleolar protein [Perkinsela sp. CCAP 1560/4]
MSYALTEVPAGFALVRVQGTKTALHSLHKFKSSKEAVDSTVALVQSELSKPLKKFLKKNLPESIESLAVLDSKLGKIIKQDFSVPVIHGDDALLIMRQIRADIDDILTEVSQGQMRQTTLGLSHNMNRFKLRYSPDKIDQMIVQAISLLDDLDKELNKYAMRAREWYGWHFPELGKIVTDNIEYAKVALALRTRDHIETIDTLESIVGEDVAERVKIAARVSMGTEISEEDVSNICQLCTEVISTHQYREQLNTYLSNRMRAIAPNLTTMVGEQIGARLIQKAGSLLSLAKFPASTVQILGAEKALFRALKKKQATPKYGILYNASLVSQAAANNKGTMSRVLAAKTALSARVDSFAETELHPAAEFREKVTERLSAFDKIVAYGKSGKARGGINPAYNRDAAVKRSRDGSSGGDMYKRQRL